MILKKNICGQGGEPGPSIRQWKVQTLKQEYAQDALEQLCFLAIYKVLLKGTRDLDPPSKTLHHQTMHAFVACLRLTNQHVVLSFPRNAMSPRAKMSCCMVFAQLFLSGFMNAKYQALISN